MAGADTPAQPGSQKLLDDVTAALDAIKNKDWVAAGIDGISGLLDVLGGTGSPLSALTEAGFGFVLPFIDFLDEPRQQLMGNPGSITASAEGHGGGGQSVTGIADTYRQSVHTDTTGWHGAASAGYQNNGGQRADAIDALGKSSTGISSAISGAGQVVSQVAEAVLQLATDAVGMITAIMALASAASESSFGGSVAAGIPPSVGVATDASATMASQMSKLMDSAKKLMDLIQAIRKVVTDAEKLLQTLAPTGGGSGGGTAPQSTGGTSSAGTDPTGPAPAGTDVTATAPGGSIAPDALPAARDGGTADASMGLTAPASMPMAMPVSMPTDSAGPETRSIPATPVTTAGAAVPGSGATNGTEGASGQPTVEVNVVVVEEVEITPGK